MTDLEQLCTFSVAGVEVGFAVSRMEWSSGIGVSDRVTLEVVPQNRADRFTLADDLVTKLATLRWETEVEVRTAYLVVVETETVPGGLRVQAMSREAVLSERVDYRVFVDKSVVDAAREVMEDRGFSVRDVCRETHSPHPQIVQHFESDLAFVSRILADEGILWLTDPDQDFAITFVDTRHGFPDLGTDAFTILDESSQSQEDIPALFHTELVLRNVTDRVTLRDYDFQKPAVDLTVESRVGQALEWYEYHGPYTDPTEGKRLAQLRLEALRRDQTILLGSSRYRGLRAGHVIELASPPYLDGPTSWLVTEVHIILRARGEAEKEGYHIALRAIPSETPYRIERTVRDTRGVETATVTGPSGEDIHTEEHSRITAQFRWDRRRPADQNSSTWCRVIQPATSGAILIPRTKWEELTGFWTGSADTPLAMGRLYEAKAEPPSSLPGTKTSTAFGTLTTPGGGTANRVAFDDSAGKEKMCFNASFDFNERTEKDKVTYITATEDTTVGVDRETIVKQVHELGVSGSQTITVGGIHDISIGANHAISTGSEGIAVGGARIFNIAGDQTTQASVLARMVGGAKVGVAIEQESVLVKGASLRNYSSSWTQIAAVGVDVSVGGRSSFVVAGQRSVKCRSYDVKPLALKETIASRSENCGGDWVWNGKGGLKYQVSGACSMKGSEVVFEATSKIEIKAGGVSVTITGGKVQIKGTFKSSQPCKDKGAVKYN